MAPITGRLKDVLWSLRQQFGLQADIDRIIPFLAFEKDLDQNQLEGLFADHPKRTPQDYNSALLERIRYIIRQYWSYRQTRKGYHRVLRGVILLENVVRYGFEGCRLVFDKNTGYQLELRPRYR